MEKSQEMAKEDLYSLNELIQILEDIRDDKRSTLNFPKALLTLCKAIKEKDKYIIGQLVKLEGMINEVRNRKNIVN